MSRRFGIMALACAVFYGCAVGFVIGFVVGLVVA